MGSTDTPASWCGRCVIVISAMVLLSCSGGERSSIGSAALRGGDSGAGAAPVGAFAGLPTLPLDVPGHTPAVIGDRHIDGVDAFDNSPGCSPQASTLLVWTIADNFNPTFEWALYRYTPAVDETVLDVDFDLNVVAGSNSWIGVANYTQNRWEFGGPFNTGGGGTRSFSGLDTGAYESPGGNFYFLVAAFNGGAVTVQGLDVSTDIPAPTKFIISGRVVNTENLAGIPGITVTLTTTGATDVTDNLGVYSFSDLDAGSYDLAAPTVTDFTVSPAGGYLGIMVGPDAGGRDFSATPAATPVGFDLDIKPLMYANKMDHSEGTLTSCTECHGPTWQNGNMRLDSYQRVVDNADEVYAAIDMLTPSLDDPYLIPGNEDWDMDDWDGEWMPDNEDNNKQQWSVAQVALFRAWMDGGFQP